jgi:cell division septum initiation protein DivIVA
MSEDIVGQIKDIKGRTWQEAFYIQTKAFLEKNSEHLKEIERLNAEVERLRIAGGESEPRFVLLSDYRHLKAETDNLKTQVERLTKAGDAIAYRYALALSDSYGNGTEEDAMDTLNNPDREELVNWKSAKEGKQP